jgi:biotin transport system substrate-specific component
MPKTNHARSSDARELTTSALLAALLAVSAFVTLPVSLVPVTLQTFVLVLIALIQRPSRAALTVGAYLLAGAVGFPVFSGMRGGFGVLLGPTGGFLVGFLAGTCAGAWVRERLQPSVSVQAVADAMAAATLIAIVYACGWLQLALVTSTGAMPALLAGVVPFLVPDALKATGAIVLAPIVREATRAR